MGFTSCSCSFYWPSGFTFAAAKQFYHACLLPAAASPSGFIFCSCTAILPSELPFFQLYSYHFYQVGLLSAALQLFHQASLLFACAEIFHQVGSLSAPAERFPKAGFLSTASKLFYQADCSCKAISPSGIILHLPHSVLSLSLNHMPEQSFEFYLLSPVR